mmetsp:Transcript_16796/g.20966  ORF Transcript_16796/g.20966 Transcript_16796/m.20966 type:complete len:108 (+) Transcript_16796:76-399(+)|eukprot:CAMPEP_0172496730 /NCGR_PEP_ID=MMETSP1066-20121228/91935_1 /TAXON_ID=671091 /ORGANISM="Coscinodiscus wailesii, Strain CCMP2513" /LENGTH=107 /DNA_ID=CAMNT_0013269171 /DNA_START=76 /DNA_END=399 /DNA_ORIENTATION=-
MALSSVPLTTNVLLSTKRPIMSNASDGRIVITSQKRQRLDDYSIITNGSEDNTTEPENMEMSEVVNVGTHDCVMADTTSFETSGCAGTKLASGGNIYSGRADFWVFE